MITNEDTAESGSKQGTSDSLSVKVTDAKGGIGIINRESFPLLLQFGERSYILRVTKQGKLILN